MPQLYPDIASKHTGIKPISCETELCLFRYTNNEFRTESVASTLDPSARSVFPSVGESLSEILSHESQLFLNSVLRDTSVHYVLLLSKANTPILIVTSLLSYGGLCLAIALSEEIDTVLSYLRTIPQITVKKIPSLASRIAATAFDPAAIERLQGCFRHIFTFFEAPFSSPSCYSDSTALFRLMKQKLSSLSSLFGISPGFLLPYSFHDAIQTDLTVNTDLFIASALLIFFHLERNSIGSDCHVVFLSIDGYPSVCIHFYGILNSDREEDPFRFARSLSEEYGGYFRSIHGEAARKESEKIPGVGYILKNDSRAPLGEHILCVFSPTERDWTSFVSHSPIFHLPDCFYEGF